MKILVSACLLGIPCRYDGAGKADPAIEKLRQGGHTLIPVCPEILGGLPTPRPPAERLPDGRVVTREGKDVTAEYRSGAEQALALARKQGCVLAVLKERSPSCGRGRIYDGTFSRTLIPGSGVGSHRTAVDRETVGVPVIAVGVPTVIDGAALDSGTEAAPQGLYVTPRDIDRQVRQLGRLLGYGISLAVQPGLTAEDLAALAE